MLVKFSILVTAAYAQWDIFSSSNDHFTKYKNLVVSRNTIWCPAAPSLVFQSEDTGLEYFPLALAHDSVFVLSQDISDEDIIKLDDSNSNVHEALFSLVFKCHQLQSESDQHISQQFSQKHWIEKLEQVKSYGNFDKFEKLRRKYWVKAIANTRANEIYRKCTLQMEISAVNKSWDSCEFSSESSDCDGLDNVVPGCKSCNCLFLKNF